MIGGLARTGSSADRLDLLDPSTGVAFDTVQLAGPQDVDDAVAAAKAASAGWSRAMPGERSAVLTAAAAILRERAEEFAVAESRQTGKPIRLAREFDVPGTIDNVDFFAGAARSLEGRATAEYSADHT